MSFSISQVEPSQLSLSRMEQSQSLNPEWCEVSIFMSRMKCNECLYVLNRAKRVSLCSEWSEVSVFMSRMERSECIYICLE